MYWKKHTVYTFWYSLRFQVSTRVLEHIPCEYCNVLLGIDLQRMRTIDCSSEQQGRTGLTGTGGMVTSGEVDYDSGSRIPRKTWLRFAKVSLWMLAA